MKIIALILFFIFMFQGQLCNWLEYLLNQTEKDGEDSSDLQKKINQMQINIQKLRKTTLSKLQNWHYKTQGHYEFQSEQKIGDNCIQINLIFRPKIHRRHYIRYKNKIIQKLKLNFTALSEKEFSVKIYDAENNRYQIPSGYPFIEDNLELLQYQQKEAELKSSKHQIRIDQHQFNINNAPYKIEYVKKPFSFRIVRKFTNEVIFNSGQDQLIYSDYYIQFATTLPSSYLYGLGERNAKFRIRNGIHTIFNRDRPWLLDDGRLPGKNTYSSHPVYLVREQSKNYHMMLLRNSNAMDFELRNLPFQVKRANKKELNKLQQKQKIKHSDISNLNQQQYQQSQDNEEESLKFNRLMQRKKLLFKLSGGIIDLRFFLGEEDPEQCIKLYHKYLGSSLLPPFWSLGFHQSRWGYKSYDDLEHMALSYTQHGIPLDTIWSDIDYMQDYIMFTVNESNFPSKKMQQLAKKYYYIPIIDFGVSVDKLKGQQIYQEGLKYDIYVKNTSQENLWGWVWPGQVVYPDFFHPNITLFWSEQLTKLHSILPFSGIWLDMNEPSNFCKGQCPLGDIKRIKDKRIRLNSNQMMDYSLDLPYNIGGENLENMTISLNSSHYGNHIEFNVHNYNGFLQSYETYKYFTQDQQNQKNNGKPSLFAQHNFILSRSTVPGSGRYTFHWTGDNVAEFEWMKVSISGIFNFNMFGIQMTGADICGFQGNTTPELCARWIQLGAFYPFARNHNAEGFIDQELYNLGPTVLHTGLESLKLRYSLLKYYYYLFVKSQGYGTIFRPVFFEFFDDDETLNDWIVDSQALIGKNILIAPILEEGKLKRKIYLPVNTVWYEYQSGDIYKGGKNYSITNKFNESCTFFVRAGSILFVQDVEYVTSTRELNNKFQIRVAFEEGQDYDAAKGSILALNKYGDDLEFKNKVEQCQKLGCEYVFIVTRQKNKDFVNVHIKYKGKSKIREQIVITSILIYGQEYFDIQLSSQFVIDNDELEFQVSLV